MSAGKGPRTPETCHCTLSVPQGGDMGKGACRGERAKSSLNKLKVQIKLTCSICVRSDCAQRVGRGPDPHLEGLGSSSRRGAGTAERGRLPLCSVDHTVADGDRWLMSSLRTGLRQQPVPDQVQGLSNVPSACLASRRSSALGHLNGSVGNPYFSQITSGCQEPGWDSIEEACVPAPHESKAMWTGQGFRFNCYVRLEGQSWVTNS